MHRIFGQKKSSGSQGPSEKEKQEAEEAKQVNLDKTVQNQEDRVKQLQAKYDSCNKDLAQYKKQLQNTKSPAAQKNIKQQMKRILQRRKMIDEQLNSAYSSLNTLSQVRWEINIFLAPFNEMSDEGEHCEIFSFLVLSQSTFAIENAQMMQENLKAQKAAIHHMKEQHQQLDIDDIEDMQDDMAEILGDMEDVNDLMGRNFGYEQ